MFKLLKRLDFQIIPLHIFFGVFWFKNGVIDKVFGILLADILRIPGAYQGDSWHGWKEYIVGMWDKSKVAHVIFSPFYDVLFPVVIVLQVLPAMFIAMSLVKGEFLVDRKRPMLRRAATASLFVTSAMIVTETLAGASDGEYLWHLLGFGMVALLFILYKDKQSSGSGK